MSKRTDSNSETDSESNVREASKRRRVTITLKPQKAHFTRKYKVSSILNTDFKGYKQIFRNIAEEFSILRRDAMNFALLIMANCVANGIFTECFPSDKSNLNNIEDYEFALENPIPYFMFSNIILTKVEFNFNISRIKKWSLLPIPAHKIVYLPISGPITMYSIHKLALTKGLSIPENCYNKQLPGELVTANNFTSYIYVDEKEYQFIWETIFNLDHVQKKRI
ncbi:hypothetical protein K501DRAFT_265056 [Backusella circina FSU 941]|nr:hypothetical protein K501DRAFT_265056 [Backusella circina FSU 941]